MQEMTGESRGGSRAAAPGIRQMSRQVSRGSACEDKADEQAGVPRLSWRLSILIINYKLNLLKWQKSQDFYVRTLEHS